MPTKTGKDSKGCYAQWGSQKKYYYECGNKEARKRAIAKANKQGRAAHAHGYGANMAKNKHYQQIVFNLKPIVRNDRMMDKDYLVAPMVMMVEGVLAGNCGPIMYPFDSMAEVPHIWNSKPVVVYHPETNGVHGSACTPEELTVRSIGTIMNTKAEDGKLTAEAWLDPERVEKVDSRILEAIENQTTLELSTGLFMDVTPEEGEFNGKAYTGIASNFRPDHLAVLPDMEGACSIEDGAGFIRVNMKFTENELSNNDVRSQLSRLVDANVSNEDGYAYVEDVFDSYYIYEYNNKLFKQDYEIESDGTTVKLTGLPIEVVRKMTYEIVKNEMKGDSMDKKKLVDEIISNESIRFDEDDRETLMAMNEDALKKMIPEVKEPEKTEVQNAAEEGAKELKPEPMKVQTVNEYIAGAPKEIQQILNHGLNTYNEKRNSLVETIISNELNTFSKEYLVTKDIKELEAIARFCKPVANESDNRFDYSGQAPVANMEIPEETLDLPSTL